MLESGAEDIMYESFVLLVERPGPRQHQGDGVCCGHVAPQGHSAHSRDRVAMPPGM